MKTLPVLLLGGLLTSVCWAAPSGHMDDGTLTITGLPTPPPPIEAEPEPLLLDSDIRAPEPKTVIKRPKRSNEKTVLAPHKPSRTPSMWGSARITPWCVGPIKTTTKRWPSRSAMNKKKHCLSPQPAPSTLQAISTRPSTNWGST